MKKHQVHDKKKKKKKKNHGVSSENSVYRNNIEFGMNENVKTDGTEFEWNYRH